MHTHHIGRGTYQGPQEDCPWCGDKVDAGLVALRWNKTADGLPQKPGKRDYEQIECMIMLPNGDLEISVWNCEHDVWDDAEGDDYRYDPAYPTHWIPLAPLRAALRAHPAPETEGGK